MRGEMRQALTERQGLIEARASALLNTALGDGQSWAARLGAPPKDARAAAAWQRHLLTVAAYRDRYGITDLPSLGAPAESGSTPPELGLLSTERAPFSSSRTARFNELHRGQ